MLIETDLEQIEEVPTEDVGTKRPRAEPRKQIERPEVRMRNHNLKDSCIERYSVGKTEHEPIARK